MIEATQIATMRYAPEGSSAVNLYSNGAADGLTIGQLVISVCLRTAMSYERQSVNKMNQLAKNADILKQGAQWVERIVNESASWTRVKAFLTGTLKVTEAELPEDLKTYDNRLKAASLATDKMNSIMQTQQQDLVAMQSYVSRRDTAFSSSTNIVRAMGRSMGNLAGNMVNGNS
jgi:hypothetical protein